MMDNILYQLTFKESKFNEDNLSVTLDRTWMMKRDDS